MEMEIVKLKYTLDCTISGVGTRHGEFHQQGTETESALKVFPHEVFETRSKATYYTQLVANVPKQDFYRLLLEGVLKGVTVEGSDRWTIEFFFAPDECQEIMAKVVNLMYPNKLTAQTGKVQIEGTGAFMYNLKTILSAVHTTRPNLTGSVKFTFYPLTF